MTIRSDCLVLFEFRPSCSVYADPACPYDVQTYSFSQPLYSYEDWVSGALNQH